MAVRILDKYGVAYQMAYSSRPGGDDKDPPLDTRPSLFWYQCEHCQTRFAVILYMGANGPTLAWFPNRGGGFSTLHTPDTVAHFVNEAYKCFSVGARVASVAMFRVALDQILFDAGYKEGMLHAKIEKLEVDKGAGSAPIWVMDLTPEFMHVIKRLGNIAIHPKEIEKLAVFADEIIAAIQITMEHLLTDIYERDAHEKELLGALIATEEKSS